MAADNDADVLTQAKAIQRRSALEQKCWVTLAFIEDMIAEIERLRPGKPAAIVDIRKRVEQETK